MASEDYYKWLDAGRPFTLCRPGIELQKLFQAAGYVVYAYPDEAHLMANPPQDHTPFSATGWPIASRFGVGHAIDIMPKAGLTPLHVVAGRIISAKNANAPGTQCIKYMNSTDVSNVCWHDSWQPGHARTISTDRGHIHISFRSDMDTSDAVSRSGWNPITGGNMSLTQADVSTILGSDVVPWTDAKEGSVAWTLLRAATAAERTEVLAKIVRDGVAALQDRPQQTVDGPALVAAFLEALRADPSAVDALATAVASRLGMIPTAGEIARAVGELNWHGRIES